MKLAIFFFFFKLQVCSSEAQHGAVITLIQAKAAAV